MNTLRNQDAVIGAWLNDGPQTLPADTRRAITVGIRTLTRRRAWIVWPFPRPGLRTIEPRRLSALLGGATVLVVVAALALNLYANRQGVGVVPSPSPTASPSVESSSPPGFMWPESTLEEVKAAQELADAEDPRYRWQVDPALESYLAQGGPYHSEIFVRFLREEFGWEQFHWTLGNGAYEGHVVFLRCALGPTNPVFPYDPTTGGGDCAPTLDEVHYETVQIEVAQPDRPGPKGIWVVAGWEMLEPFWSLPATTSPSLSATGMKLCSWPTQHGSEAGTILGCSRDGSRLLIQKDQENLFIVHADDSVTQVTDQLSGFRDIPGSGRPSGATISPDGSRVVFAGLTKAWEEGHSCHDGALFAVDADGDPAEVLWESQIPQNGIVMYPAFSPDGTHIAFVDGYCDSYHSVWVMSADGRDAHQIVSSETTPGGHVQGLAWSATGDRIALSMTEGTFAFATDGSDFARVADALEFCWPGRQC